MTVETKQNTWAYDLFKALVALALLIAILVLAQQGQVPQAGKPLAAGLAVPVLNAPQLPAGGGVSLSGAGEPGSTVEVWADGVKLGTTSVADDGTWSFNGKLDPGEYEVVARTVDAGGEVLNESAPLAVSVPEAELAVSVPEAEGTVGEPEPAASAVPSKLTGTEFDADGGMVLSGTGEPGSSVEVWADGVKLGTTSVADDGTWSFNGKLDPGEHEIVARTVDAEGEVLNETASTAISGPEAEATVSGPEAEATGGPEAEPTTVSGPEAEATGVPEAEPTTVGGPEAEATGVPEAEPTTVGGPEAEATGVPEPELAVSPPELTETDVDQSGRVTLTGTGAPGTTVEILEDGILVGTAVVQDDGSWTFTYTAAPGEHTLAAQNQGEPDSVSAGLSLEVTAAEPGAAEEETPISSEAPPGQLYVVQDRDWLMYIALRLWGDEDLYPLIVEATNAKAAEDATFRVITNPNRIYPGQKLWIPDR